MNTKTADSNHTMLLWRGIFGLAALLAVVIQYFDFARFFAEYRTFPGGIIKYFSYFTIQINFLAALWNIAVFFLLLSFVSGNPRPAQNHWVSSPGVKMAVANYIIVVGIVYFAILAANHHPLTLAGKVINVFMHLIFPVVFAADFLLSKPVQKLPLRVSFFALIFPILYTVFILTQGALTGWYPYFFLNPAKSPVSVIAIYISVLVIVFALISLALRFVYNLRFRMMKKVIAD